MSKEPSCDFCGKNGLPILPVRYAIAPVEASAPRLRSQFKMASPVPLGRFVHYTTRLVRSGFVYVYDEARRRWAGYYVTENGYYLPFDILKPMPPALKDAVPCSRGGHPEVASCITISAPKQATMVWIGYSPSQWTKATLAKHESVEYRKRHMRALDVRAWWASQAAAHAERIGTVAHSVAEYAPATEGARFAFSTAAFQRRQKAAAGLVQAAERMAPGKGVIVALDDPAGIVKDIAQLMQAGVRGFVSRPQYKRKLAASTAIEQLRQGIKNQAELQAIADADLAARRAVNPGSGFAGEGGGAANAGMALARSLNRQLDQDLTRLEERLRNVTPAELDAAGNSAWRKYSKKYDEKGRAAWQASFDAKMKQFDRIFVAPLAKAHAQWMRSDALYRQFACNHDPNDVHSGVAYAAHFALCIEGTQDKKACFDTYRNWLQGNPEDKRALALRAILLNQDKLATEAKKAEGGLDPRSVPWDAMIGAYDKTVEAVGASAPPVVAKLVMQLGAPFIALLDQAVDAGVRPGLVALGMAGQAPIVRVTATGSRKAFRAVVIRQLLSLHGGKLDRHAMQRAVSAELRRLQMHGVPMQGAMKKSFFMLADPAVVKGMPQGLSTQQRANWLASSLRTVEQYEATELARWRSVVTTKVRLGVVTAIAQVAVFTKVSSDKEGAMAHEAFDAATRYWAGVAAISGGVAETVGAALNNAANAGSLRYAPNAARSLSRFIQANGGRVSLVAAVIIAVMDLGQAHSSYKEGQYELMGLYVVSAGLGVVMLFAFGLGLVFGIVVVLLFVVVAVLIELMKDNKLQDWLERSAWGTLPGSRYPSLEAEQRELKLALVG